MTVVYVDSVFVLNGIMDYLLLMGTARLAGVPLRRRRCLLGALLGGAYAVAVFLPGLGFLAAGPVKLAFGVLLSVTVFGGQAQLLRLTVLLFAVSCAMAGCVLGLGLLTGGVPVVNGIFYTDVDAHTLLLGATASYAVLAVIFRAAARHGVRRELIRATVCLGEREIQLTALLDNGSTLSDPITGEPVLVAAPGALNPLLPPRAQSILTGEVLRSPADWLEELCRAAPSLRFTLLPYQSVGVRGGLLLAVRCRWVEIGGTRYPGVLAALAPAPLGSGYQALWGGQVRGGRNEKHTFADTAAAAPARTSGAGEHPLHRGQRYAAAAAQAGAGGGADRPDRRRVRPAGTDRTQPAAGGLHRPPL